MSETSQASTLTARLRARKAIALPDGDELIPRRTFAADELQVSDRTAAKYNLKTVYIAGIAHVPRNASLKEIGARARQATRSRRARRVDG